MKAATVFVAVACLASLAACSYRLRMKIDGPLEQPTVSIKAPAPMSPRSCVRSFWVTLAGQPDVRLWEVSAATQPCLPLPAVSYGVTPVDFISPHEARPLEAGLLYEAVVRASGGAGRMEFVFEDGQWRSTAAFSAAAAQEP